VRRRVASRRRALFAQFIRDTVRQSVLPVSIEQPNPVRAELLRSLAKEFSVEHLLWRSVQEEEEISRRWAPAWRR
jgi:hypothetical protein